MKTDFKKININIQKRMRHIIKNWSRLHTIILFFSLFFFVIIKTLFSYTVMDYGFYKWLADNQQIWKFSVPLNRWTIYWSWKSQSILATSLNLYDISIDPQMEWDKQKLADFLTNLVYSEICENKSYNICYTNFTRFMRVLEVPDFNDSEEYIKNAISESIVSDIMRTKVTSVMIDRQLNEEQIEQLNNLNITWIYPWDNYLYVNPEEFNNENDNNITNISRITWVNEETFKHLTRKRNLRYVPIYRKLSINGSDFVNNYLDEEWEALKRWLISEEESISNFIILSPNPSRYYPEWDVASQVTWFVDSSWVGHYWIEWYYNDILKWNNWEIISTKDIQWRMINPTDLDTENLIWEWVEIHTTIDRNIQKKVEEILAKWVENYRANRWRVVVMDPKTWNVLAMANYPTYDVNNYWDVYELERIREDDYENPSKDLLGYPIYVEDRKNWIEFIFNGKKIFLREASRDELSDRALVKYKYKNDYGAQVYTNHVISSLYEAGSIIKPLTVAIWLDSWEIDENSMYQDDWFLTIDNFKISNVSDRCLWYQTFSNALRWSCNVWMIRIVQKVWKTLMHQYLEKFWIWFKTWIELSWETASRMQPWENWSQAWLLTRSYGLWLSVTQMQVAAAYNVLANGWIFVKPKIIDKIVYPDGRVVNFKTEEQRRVIKESSAQKVTQMLYDWTHSWWWAAEQWAIDDYRFALKSWTAQIAYMWGYETWVWSTVASFAWYWPIEDPRFVMVVSLERPRTSVYGWSTSSKIWQDIWNYLVDYFEIPKRDYQFNNFYRNEE